MAVQLEGVAQLPPRRDAVAMAEAFLWTAKHPVEARAQAMRGRELVQREWSREKAFGDLRRVIDDCIGRPALAEAS